MQPKGEHRFQGTLYPAISEDISWMIEASRFSGSFPLWTYVYPTFPSLKHMPFRFFVKELGAEGCLLNQTSHLSLYLCFGGLHFNPKFTATIPGLTICKKSSKGWNFYWYSKCSTSWNTWDPINQGICGFWGPYQLVRWPAFLGQLEVGALSSNFSMATNCQTSQPYRCQTRDLSGWKRPR